MLSSKEILDRTDIGSVKTLTRWHQRELIPPPEVRTHPSGRGKLAYWPSWVIWRIKEVKSRLGQGDSLDEIAEDLGSDWQAEEQRWTRKRRDTKRVVENEKRRAATQHFADAVAERVYEFLKAMGIQRPGIFNQLDEKLSDHKLVKRAIQLAKDGFNVVAIVEGEDIYVTADFVVSKTLGHDYNSPLLIVPLSTSIREAFADIEEAFPEEPLVASSDIVADSRQTEATLNKFTVGKNWTFTTTKPTGS